MPSSGRHCLAAMKRALDAHAAEGAPLCLRVRRPVRKPEAPAPPGRLRMSVGDGGDIAAPMVEPARTMPSDFYVVLFHDGNTKLPNNNLSARAQASRRQSVCVHRARRPRERYNPGMRPAVEVFTGEFSLPQLFVAGKYVGDLHSIEGQGRCL